MSLAWAMKAARVSGDLSPARILTGSAPQAICPSGSLLVDLGQILGPTTTACRAGASRSAPAPTAV